MTVDEKPVDQRLADWVGRLAALTDQIATWSAEQGWEAKRGNRHLADRTFGGYDVPTLDVRAPGGELYVRPVAVRGTGENGRVELEAYPTLHRVHLIGRGEAWEVLTDSNVRLRQPWSAETFVQLVGDLLG